MVFKYKAKDSAARVVLGEIEAADVRDATVRLSERDLFVVEVTERPKKKSRHKLNSKELAEFSKQLSLMLYSGLTLVKALNILAGAENITPKTREVYLGLHRSLKGGMALSDAMREQEGTFPELIMNMFYSGEISGTMSSVAEKMADYYTADHKLRKKVKQASTYPKILLFLTVTVLIIIFAFVLPSILDMLGDQELPLITAIMKGISDIIVNRWYTVLIVGAIAVLIYLYATSIRAVKYFIHKMLLKIKKIGPLFKIIYTARFARTLSSLYGSGIQLVTAVTVSSRVIGNLYLEDQFPALIQQIKQGDALSVVLGRADGFDNKLQNIVLIGEETGRLDEILDFAAGTFEYDADAAISSLLSMLEPALLIIMAVLIGAVIISVLLPIYQMYDTAGSGGF